MSNTNFDEIIRHSLELRKKYHQLELEYHRNEWTVEEDDCYIIPQDKKRIGEMACFLVD